MVEPFQNLMSRRALCGKKVKKTRNMSRCLCFFCRLFGGDAVLVLTWIIWRCGCRFRLSEASTKTIMVPCEDLIKKIRRSNIMASDISAAAAETGCDDFMEMSGATVPCFTN